MRAMRAASSPARSRLAVVLETAISRRRSRAVGWRRAMMDGQVAVDLDLHRLTRLPVSSTCVAPSALNWAARRPRGDLRLDQAAHLQHARRDA
jgi:hypothetical protein